MLVHKAVRQRPDRAVCQVHLQQFQVDTEIGGMEEHALAIAAALRHMIGQSRPHIEHCEACSIPFSSVQFEFVLVKMLVRYGMITHDDDGRPNST
jgi:hypothetical protein